jgi:NADH-quinone oxidoreductase subunit A
MSFILMSVII